MRHIWRISILVLAGVMNLVQAGDHIQGNAPDRRGLPHVVAELGLSRGDIVARHRAVEAKGHNKGSKKGAGKKQISTIQTNQTVTVSTTLPGETKTVQTSIQKGDGAQENTKTVQMTVVEEVKPVAQNGTCAVVSQHITSTMIEHLTITVPAPAVAPVTQTIVQTHAATTLTVQVTHTVTASTSPVVGQTEVGISAPAITNAPNVPSVAPPAGPATEKSPAATTVQVSSSLVVGGAGQVASGTGTLMENGACNCMCLCSTGSFPTVAAMPQPPAQPATTLATSIISQASSITSGLLVDTSSPPPAVAPSSVDTSTVAISASSSASPDQLSSTASAASSTLPSPVVSSPTSESVSSVQTSSLGPSETTSSTSTFTAENAVLPSPLPATQAFSLKLTIPAGPQPTDTILPLIAPIDVQTLSLTSALILGSLAKPTPI